MIVLGIILIVLSYVVAVPPIVTYLAWILVVVGVVFLVLGNTGRPVGGRKVWF
jgi:hypothetical protein